MPRKKHHTLVPPGRLMNARERLRSSLWFIPALFVVAGLALATAALAVDEYVTHTRGPWFVLGTSASSAQHLMSTIASSTFTFTGVVFTITVVVLQLTSSQYSSRVLRTFLQDRPTQVGLGTFAGTFAFALRVLPSIEAEGPGEAGFVPVIATTTAFGLMLVSLAAFLYYLDHMAQAIRAVSIIARIGKEGRQSVEECYPETAWHPEEPAEPRPERPTDDVVVNEGLAGIVTSMAHEDLVELAREREAVIEVVPMVGDFVPHGAVVFRVWLDRPPRAHDGDGTDGRTDGGPPPPDAGELLGMISIGLERTPLQDPLYSFRELVDIGERALSPGINDPTTAVQALDQIHDLLRMVVTRPFPPPLRRDATGKVRLLLHEPDWGLFVRLGLTEIRQYGEGSVQVARKLRAALLDLLSIAPPPRRPVLEEQLRLADEAAARAFHSREDERLARLETHDEHAPAPAH